MLAEPIVEEQIVYFHEMAKMDDVKAQVGELSRSHQQLALKVAGLEGQITVPKKPPHPWVVPIITVSGTAFIAFLAWMAITLIGHGATLAEIRQGLHSLGLEIAANKPETKEAQENAKVALIDAKKYNERIPQSIFASAGLRFIDASEKHPAAWGVVSEFLSYRSSLNASFSSSSRNVESAENIDPAWKFQFPMDSIQARGRQLLKISFRPPTGDAISRRIDEEQADPIAKGPSLIIFTGVGQMTRVTLDDFHLRKIVFKNVTVTYHGGPTRLEDVTFVNCWFEIDRQPRGYLLARDVIESTSPSISFVD